MVIKLVDDENGLNVEYFTNFLDEKTADKYFEYFKNIEYNSDEESKIKIFGKEHFIPRKQVGYGDDDLKYSFSGIKVKAKKWTPELLEIKKLVQDKTKKEFNYCLINYYEDCDHFLNYHQDDERDLGEKPDIAGVTFGAKRRLLFKNIKNQKLIREIRPNNGSLYIMRYPTNSFWKHSIPKEKAINKPRISLTFRYIHQ